MPQANSPYLSVTECLDRLGLGRYSNSKIPDSVLDKAGERGHILHLSFAHFLKSEPRVIYHTVEGLEPYQRAFERAVHELGIGKPIYSEYAMRSDSLQLDGILDYFGPVRDELAFIDFKTGDPKGRHPDGTKYEIHPSIGWQVAGYQELLSRDGIDYSLEAHHAKRYALYLRSNGSYRWIELDNPSDRTNMLAAVRVANLQRRLQSESGP